MIEHQHHSRCPSDCSDRMREYEEEQQAATVLSGQAFEQAIHQQRYLDVCNSHRALQQECDLWRDTAITIAKQRDKLQQTCEELRAMKTPDAALTPLGERLEKINRECNQRRVQPSGIRP